MMVLMMKRVGLMVLLVSCAPVGQGALEEAVLGAPTMVTVTPTAPGRATVSWDPVAGAIKYYVYISGSPPTIIGTTRAPGTSFPAAHLMGETTYCFEARADDGSGPSPASASVCATQPGPPPPPPNLVASSQTAGTVNLTWDGVAAATKYYVYDSNGASGPFVYRTTAVATSIRLSIPTTGTHCFEVMDVSPNGVSAPSNIACFPDGLGWVTVSQGGRQTCA